MIEDTAVVPIWKWGVLGEFFVASRSFPPLTLQLHSLQLPNAHAPRNKNHQSIDLFWQNVTVLYPSYTLRRHLPNYACDLERPSLPRRPTRPAVSTPKSINYSIYTNKKFLF